MKKLMLVFLAIGSLLVAGCASTSGQVYSRAETREVHHIEYGVVLESRVVKIEGTKSGVGALSGAALGAVAGSSIGSGRGAALGAIGGGLLGALAGNTVEEKATRSDGLELVVELDNGRVISIVQKLDVQINKGDRVKVITQPDGVTRISPSA